MSMKLKVPEWIFIYKDGSSSSSNSLIDNNKHHLSPAFASEYCDSHTRVIADNEHHYFHENQCQTRDTRNLKHDVQGRHLDFPYINNLHNHAYGTETQGSYNYRHTQSRSGNYKQDNTGGCNYLHEHNLHRSSNCCIGDRFRCDNKRIWDTHDHRMHYSRGGMNYNKISDRRRMHRLHREYKRDMKRPWWTNARKFEWQKSPPKFQRWNGRGYPPSMNKRFAK